MELDILHMQGTEPHVYILWYYAVARIPCFDCFDCSIIYTPRQLCNLYAPTFVTARRKESLDSGENGPAKMTSAWNSLVTTGCTIA